jgi:hypothetical protein
MLIQKLKIKKKHWQQKNYNYKNNRLIESKAETQVQYKNYHAT